MTYIVLLSWPHTDNCQLSTGIATATAGHEVDTNATISEGKNTLATSFL